MSHLVTLNLPADLARRAQEIAARSQRPVEDVLLEWLDHAATDVPVELLPDEQVLALRDQQMREDQQRELADLLARQREGKLDPAARRRLDAFL